MTLVLAFSVPSEIRKYLRVPYVLTPRGIRIPGNHPCLQGITGGIVQLWMFSTFPAHLTRRAADPILGTGSIYMTLDASSGSNPCLVVNQLGYFNIGHLSVTVKLRLDLLGCKSPIGRRTVIDKTSGASSAQSHLLILARF